MTLRKAFDGEVYYWYEDDPTARREVSKVDPLRFINAKIYTQADLDQARKDAREAAFKESVAIIVGQPVAHYIYSGSQSMTAETFRDNCVKVIEATIAIEAARKQ